MLDHHNTLIIFIRPTYSEGLGNQQKNHSKHLVGSPFEVEVLPVTGCYIDHKNLSWHKKRFFGCSRIIHLLFIYDYVCPIYSPHYSNCHPLMFRVSKTYKHHKHTLGTFWITWNIWTTIMLFCCILQFGANHAPLTVHKNQKATLYCRLETQD